MSLTKLPPEVLLMVGAYCAYEDLHSLIQVNQYLSGCLQPSLNAHKAFVERYHSLNVHDSGTVPFDADRSYYTYPLFILNEVEANPGMLHYVKHFKIGRMDAHELYTNQTAEYQRQLNDAWQRVNSSVELWLQSTPCAVVENDIAAILQSCQRPFTHSFLQPSTREYHQLLILLLFVLLKLKHLEICGIKQPWSNVEYRMDLSDTGPIATTLNKCMEVKRKNQDSALAEYQPLPAFQNLTHLTIRSVSRDRDVLQDLTHLAILPCVRQLDVHGFVERVAIELDWSVQSLRGVEAPWEQVFFHSCEIPPNRLKRFCTSLAKLVRVQYSPLTKIDTGDYLNLFAMACAGSLTKAGFAYRLADVEGEASLTLVVERDGP